MIPPELGALLIIALTIIVTAELIRRYYLAKFEYEYKTKRLEHDQTFLAADGGEEGGDDGRYIDGEVRGE